MKNTFQHTLPILKRSKETFIHHWFNLALLAITLSIILLVFEQLWFNDETWSYTGVKPKIIMLILTFIYAKFACALHRVVLMNESLWRNLTELRTGDIKFFIGMLGLLFLLFSVIYAAYFFASDLFYLLGYKKTLLLVVTPLLIILGFIMSRLALNFPALAMGDTFRPLHIWKVTSNHRISLFFLVIALPFLNNWVFGQFSDANQVIRLVTQTLSNLVLIFEVIVVSHCYDQFILSQSNTETS